MMLKYLILAVGGSKISEEVSLMHHVNTFDSYLCLILYTLGMNVYVFYYLLVYLSQSEEDTEMSKAQRNCPRDRCTC